MKKRFPCSGASAILRAAKSCLAGSPAQSFHLSAWQIRPLLLFRHQALSKRVPRRVPLSTAGAVLLLLEDILPGSISRNCCKRRSTCSPKHTQASTNSGRRRAKAFIATWTAANMMVSSQQIPASQRDLVYQRHITFAQGGINICRALIVLSLA